MRYLICGQNVIPLFILLIYNVKLDNRFFYNHDLSSMLCLYAISKCWKLQFLYYCNCLLQNQVIILLVCAFYYSFLSPRIFKHIFKKNPSTFSSSSKFSLQTILLGILLPQPLPNGTDQWCSGKPGLWDS